MKRLSSVAAIACVGIISIGLTGCGGGGGGGTPEIQAATAENPCPIPQEAKAPTTLDVNKTITALAYAQGSAEMAFILADDGYYWMDSAAKQSASASDANEVTLATLVSGKVKALQKTTDKYRKSVDYGDDSIEYGDNIPCDSGSYSAHDTSVDASNNEDGVDGGSSSQTFTLTFNQCVLEDNDANSNLIAFFTDMMMYSSMMYHVGYTADPDPVLPVYTFNGSLALEYSEDYTYKNWNTAPLDTSGYGNQDTYQGSSSLRTENLHFDRKVGDALKESFDSNEVFSVTFNGSSEYNNSDTYESVDAYNDGNYTHVRKESDTNSISFSFEGQEESKEYGTDWNSTVSISALCYSAEMMYNRIYQRNERYEEHNEVDGNSTNMNSFSVKSSGYLAMQVEEGTDVSGFDLYAKNLKVEESERDEESWEVDVDGNWVYAPSVENAEVQVDGTVGSTLFGGSAVLATVTPWKMSSEYPGVVNYTPTPGYRGGYMFDLPYSPYEGETTVTGTNTATVTFYLEDNNDTDVNLTVNGETIHKESVYELFDMIEH